MTVYTSSTLDVPCTSNIPKHVAIVMDGNGRWAKSRLMPRFAGHKRGVDAVKRTVQACCELGVEHLTLFAFSSENWRRPEEEVSLLMRLFIRVLRKDVEAMHRENICLRIIGDTTAFEPELQAAISSAQELTKNNTRLFLNIAANYGGRWDITQACRSLAEDVAAGRLAPADISESLLDARISLAGQPPPDLFIRTGGDLRISNFLLWQLAYTELWFTETLWPDLDDSVLDAAMAAFADRERRFGLTSAQVAGGAT